MTRYLNENGADIHIAKINNETNLIASVYHEQLYFAVDPNYDSLSSLLLAAEKRRINLIDFISPQCSLLEQIEAQELLERAFTCREHGIINLQKSFEYFYRALVLRSQHNLSKVLRLSTVDVFDNREECQKIDELEEIQLNDDYMYTEALLVREHLLESTNAKYCRSLRFSGAVLADNAQHHQEIRF
ncbi:unnamed protein product [Rotaria sp. Silwood2]|nr:unnamed protein product [Rotaria sp. Silwood2]CAF2838745.1 unnamed protein product [Rotaria sp. Silwood2]CAF2933181.1 unnamed protein product [Rotaria sp. Silwood2]CAF3384309.1 unnamed protein product [Rotaria sp. Silwood2]CAF3960305.1 unnamed protein product [Rotaria sp. Silwood2]